MKHKYNLECERCGLVVPMCDDSVDARVAVLKIGCCTVCSPESARIPTQVAFDKDGNKIYY